MLAPVISTFEAPKPLATSESLQPLINIEFLPNCIHQSVEINRSVELLTQEISASYDSVLHFCLHYLKDQANGQEACQEVMLNAFNHRHLFEYRCSVKTWLLKIAFNVCTNFYRKHQRYTVRMLEYVDDASSYLVGDESLRYADTISEIEQHDNTDERFALRQKLTLATKQLSQIQQDILYYRFVEEMSLQAIADTLSVKHSSVKMNYYRALEKLNKLYTH